MAMVSAGKRWSWKFVEKGLEVGDEPQRGGAERHEPGVTVGSGFGALGQR